MDNNFNRQTNTDPYQQGNTYQQNDPYANPYLDNGFGRYGSSNHYGSNPEPVKAPNIFQQFVLAFIPPQYNRLIKVRIGSMIGFVTLLALIATIFSFVDFAFSFASFNNSGWEDAIPDFGIADGRLYMERDFVFDESGMFVYITDEISRFTYEDASAIASGGYQNILLIGRDRISVMQNGEYKQADFSDLGDQIEISKDWIVNTWMPLMMFFVIVGYIFFFVGRVLWYFLCAAIYLLIAMLIALIAKKKLSAGALFRTAVYSKVLMFVIITFLTLVPFVNISVPLSLRIAITIGFMSFAIIKLPDGN